MEMLRTVARAWKIEDLRKKIIFTLLMLLVFRLGSNIPVPGIDRAILQEVFSGDGTVGSVDLFSELSATLPSLHEHHPIHHNVHYPSTLDYRHPQTGSFGWEGMEEEKSTQCLVISPWFWLLCKPSV